MYAQKLFNPAIGFKTIWHVSPTLKKAIDYAQRIEREFLLVEALQQTEFDMVISIDAGNNPMRQQKVATITCYKCALKCHQRKDSLV